MPGRVIEQRPSLAQNSGKGGDPDEQTCGPADRLRNDAQSGPLHAAAVPGSSGSRKIRGTGRGGKP